MGLSTEFFGFRRCWNPPLCHSWGSGVRSRGGTSPPNPRSIAEQWSGGIGGGECEAEYRSEVPAGASCR